MEPHADAAPVDMKIARGGGDAPRLAPDGSKGVVIKRVRGPAALPMASADGEGSGAGPPWRVGGTSGVRRRMPTFTGVTRHLFIDVG